MNGSEHEVREQLALGLQNPLIEPRAPLSAFELVASAIVYDLALRAIPINARARRVSHSSWEVRVSTYEGGDQLPTPLDEGGNRVASSAFPATPPSACG
jgi:hypothetical protein